MKTTQGLGMIFASVVAFTFAAGDVFANPVDSPVPEVRRLIETGTATGAVSQTWMSEAQISALAGRIHAAGRCGGFMDVTDQPNLGLGAPGVQALALPLAGYPTPSHQNLVNPLLKELSADGLANQVRTLSDFNNRYYKSQSGVDAAKWIQGEFKRLSAGRADITVELFGHERFAQPSVIARIAGRGPHAAERVILGAHEDSINWSSGWPTEDDRAPGADDDASGVATLLETFRVLAQSGYQPERTLEFITYAGEERGLLGSQDIAASYQQRKIPVVAALQMDMTAFPGQKPVLNLITDYVNRDLTVFVEKIIDIYARVKWGESKCGYACSDHASWNKAGYPSAFPFESAFEQENDNIHSVRDTADLLDFNFGLHFAKISLGFAIELGSL